MLDLQTRKPTDMRFQAKILLSSPSGNVELNSHPPWVWNSPMPSEFQSKNPPPPLPQNSEMPPVVGYGYSEITYSGL